LGEFRDVWRVVAGCVQNTFVSSVYIPARLFHGRVSIGATGRKWAQRHPGDVGCGPVMWLGLLHSTIDPLVIALCVCYFYHVELKLS